jgi:hypothetical protein
MHGKAPSISNLITVSYFHDKDMIIMHDYEMHDAQQCMIRYDTLANRRDAVQKNLEG